MAFKLEQRKSELVDQVVARVHARLSKEKAPLAEAFVRQFYRNVSPVDMLHSGADELYGAAIAIWQFGCTRKPGEALVRVQNPRVDADGWHAHHTVVQIVNDDMPFLVDSVSAELNRHGLTVHLVVHPVIRVSRNGEGRITAIHSAQDAPADAVAESMMHIEVDQVGDATDLAKLRNDVAAVLADVRAAVSDFTAMRERLAATIAATPTLPTPVAGEDIAEGLSFLRWMDEEHFIFLGAREYRFGRDGNEETLDIQTGQGLGILRDDDVSVFDGLRHFSSLPPEVRSFVRQPRFMMVTKSNKDSTVHRRAPLDAVMVKLFDEAGAEIGERLFVGLFTSTAYNRSVRDIPFLRQKVTRLLSRAGFDPRGHDGKALVHILETFPRDELFQISDDELADIALGVLHLQDRQRVALFVRKDPFERFVSALIHVPRDRYDTDLRKRLQALIERAYEGTTIQANVTLAESVLARVHLIVQTNTGKVPDVDVADLERQLIEAARGWRDRLSQALVEEKGEAAGLTLARKYIAALPASFQEAYSADQAVADILCIERVLADGKVTLNLHRPVEADSNQLFFKVYQAGSPVELSQVLPMLEHLGLRIRAEGGPFEVEMPGDTPNIFLQDFDMVTADGRAVELEKVKAAFEEAFLRVWTGDAQSDGFNRLVLMAGLTWREVVVFRAYAKYLKQAKFDFSQEYIENTLATHSAIARLLMDLFRTSHDPDTLARLGRDEVDMRRKGLILEIDHALDAVSNLDEDRILRRMLNIIRATLRTNFFQKDADGQPKSYVSFKLDSGAIDDLPLPRPWREIWVYSPRVEAIHLRGGKVARGGIRWSDRREDFRTEILGLIKAQIVKNAVIVPVGSKGGFVVKNPPSPAAGREALMAEVVECYKTMMRGLLDITDNLKKGEVIPPTDVVRLDSDDPYLVVAADKGTASFSDIANGVSRDYGFWLDDAFASGGSAGYDHKGMGITARGAWEAVKRHFRERGKDIQNQDFTAVGVGDMSGDVFGNGMLLSRHIRLIAAFDHRHIFIDPNPDAATSWQERKRLFDLSRSSWADYDTAKLSPGGGIFDRGSKSIQLTPEIREALDLQVDRITPADLMRTILKAEVELLWLGGIGTYVKSHAESNADAGDKANDAIRINGRDLRVKVVGEGANLGFTQRGRIEAAQAGIAINTDAIDNSAGVDTSDHEVNIKILLRDVMDQGGMTREQRDVLLAQMTDEVAELVLADNYKQTQALTIAQASAVDTLEDQARFARAMEKAGKLSRAIEYLPDDEEFAARTAARQGLTRPELAVLLAYAKIDLYDQLLATDLPDDPAVERDLTRYFPKALQERFGDAVARHQLRREIICTAVTNGMVNRVGPTFTWEMVEQTGRGFGDAARAYLIVRDAFGLRGIWDAVEGLDNKVPAATQTAMMAYTGHLMRRAVPWVLAHGTYPLDIAAETSRLAPVVEELAGNLTDILSPPALKWVTEHASLWTEAGVPADLANRIACLPGLAAATDIAEVAKEIGHAPAEVARIYFELGDYLGLDYLRTRTTDVKAENHWQRQAIAATLDDLFNLQARLTARVLAQPADDPMAEWSQTRQGPLDRINSLLTDLRSVAQIDIAMLAVASRQLRGLLAG
ncbi:NAD-glutamate dehydrogenase [Niveispirillum irakense]|uniref:NAD-glutamate dehydrogenase n=1 Tax=Niveispirillum irakense TaxID=34011 RepID=UPI000429E5EA|nr:NAD-glutamate dehydrogenase [Niveispirillum irakense]